MNIDELEKMSPDRPEIAVILHFNATAAALSDVAHAKTAAGSLNPNRELVEKLLANGVKVWVCGQSVIRGGHALADVEGRTSQETSSLSRQTSSMASRRSSRTRMDRCRAAVRSLRH